MRWLLVSVVSGARPWEGKRLPSDMVFVKGKKVAGTTVGGIMRRLGAKYGIEFFSPTVPSRSTPAWRSGGRERWILERFAAFVEDKSGYIAWAQEQTLSPRRAGLVETSRPLAELASRAWRVTVIREPYAHALSACTHFGPCGAKTVGDKQFANRSAAARAAWVDESLGPSQMWRFITPDPATVDWSDPRAKKNATQSTVDFYHAVLLADDLDRSLVALALSTPGLELDDVLYVAAKTTHTGRRPALEQQPEVFVRHLRNVFYAGQPPSGDATGDDLAPDTELYLAAKERLRATIETIGGDAFERDLAKFQKMQKKMLASCGSSSQRLPGGLSSREARECLYGDQGCGYRCIAAWAEQRRALFKNNL